MKQEKKYVFLFFHAYVFLTLIISYFSIIYKMLWPFYMEKGSEILREWSPELQILPSSQQGRSTTVASFQETATLSDLKCCDGLR